MACPFFKPSREREWSYGRAPLGGLFHGDCDRQSGAGEPQLCNFGYARGSCRHFPDDAMADAVRFSVSGTERGVLCVVWVLERDHAPMEHGTLEYRESTREFVEPPQGVLAVQARAFVENYLRR